MTSLLPRPLQGGPGPTEAPWLGPTLHELLPDSPPGTGNGILLKRVVPALKRARDDPDRSAALLLARNATTTPVGALVAELLTPPLPTREAPRDDISS